MRHLQKEYAQIGLECWDIEREYEDFFNQKFVKGTGIEIDKVWERLNPKNEQEILDFYKDKVNVSRLLINRAKRFGFVRDVLRKVILPEDYHKNRVLDYGCGTGEYGIMLATLGYRVDFVEVSDSWTIKFLKQRLRNRYLQSRVLTEKDALNEYDFVFFIDVLEHLYKPRETFMRITNSIMSGGILLMVYDYQEEAIGADIVSGKRIQEEIMPLLNEYYTKHEYDREYAWRKK